MQRIISQKWNVQPESQKFIDTSSPVLLTWRDVHEHSCKPKTELGSSTCAKVLSHCGASNCIPSAAVICAKIRGKMYCTALHCTAIYCTARSYILNTVLRKSWPENMFGTRSESFRILLMEDFRNCFWNILQTLNRVTTFHSVFLRALLSIALRSMVLLHIALLSRSHKHPRPHVDPNSSSIVHRDL